MDVTHAVKNNKEIRLVAISAIKVSKAAKYNMAATLAHELNAHVNFSTTLWSTSLENNQVKSDLHHLQYGQFGGEVEMFDIVSDDDGGNRVQIRANARPDSIAERVAIQLGKLFGKEMGILH
jgi:hypothetical protein